MFEKPQYLTAHGYKRLDKNPCRKDSLPATTKAQKIRNVQARIPHKGKGLSEEAAKMIAGVLKEMLKEKK
jgi:hypothetical protein